MRVVVAAAAGSRSHLRKSSARGKFRGGFEDKLERKFREEPEGNNKLFLGIEVVFVDKSGFTFRAELASGDGAEFTFGTDGAELAHDTFDFELGFNSEFPSAEFCFKVNDIRVAGGAVGVEGYGWEVGGEVAGLSVGLFAGLIAELCAELSVGLPVSKNATA